MPLKLNVGLSKKLGLPDYGSLGASCYVELELAGSLIRDDLDAFHRQVRQAFIACSQSVQDELTRQQGQNAEQQTSHEPQQNQKPRNGATASTKQINYIRSLSGQISQLSSGGEDRLSQQMFGKLTPNLNGLEASNLIETLRAIKAGQLKLEDAGSRATAS